MRQHFFYLVKPLLSLYPVQLAKISYKKYLESMSSFLSLPPVKKWKALTNEGKNVIAVWIKNERNYL